MHPRISVIKTVIMKAQAHHFPILTQEPHNPLEMMVSSS